MDRVSQNERDDWRAFDGPGVLTVVAGVALVLGALCPLGLASGEAADLAAGALGVRRSFVDANPLADILARLAVLLPIGQLGFRPHILAVASGAVALAALVMRAHLTAQAGGPLAVAAGVALVGVSRPFLDVATVRPVLAIDFVLLVVIALLLDLIRRDPARSRIGLGLALACGLAAGAGWPVRVATWPLALGFSIWALRRGERWPLLAPIAFVAAAGVVLGGVVSSPGDSPANVGAVFHRLIVSPSLSAPSSPTLAPALVHAYPNTYQRAHAAWLATTDEVGVLPLLVAALGWCALVARSRAEATVWLLPWAVACAAALIDADIPCARLVLVAALVLPTGAAIAFLSRSFGRARSAVAVVLAFVLVLPPAIIGIGGALAALGRRSPATVARRLDDAVDLGASSNVGDPAVDQEAARWRRYRRAIEWRARGGW